MALKTHFLIFCIIIQITNVVHCANNEDSNDYITQIGIGNSATFAPGNFKNNVISLVSDFVTVSSRGFLNTSSGEGSDRAYGWFLCRGDLSDDKCKDCLHKIRQYITDSKNIFFYPEAFVFNTQLKCVVHYSNSSKSFEYRENTTFTGSGFGDDLDRHPRYNTTLFNSLQELAREAGGSNGIKPNFATRVVDVAGTEEKINILVQCTPDILAMNCTNCIRNLYSTFTPYRVGGDALGFNCLLKYDNEAFMGSGFGASFMPSYLHVVMVLLGTIYLTFM
ncbi:putative cysteine-rich repeat secretory protein 7 [Bienertia sinuspersici]